MPQLRYIESAGVTIALYEWGKPSKVHSTLLFVHATGFHARIWDQVIAELPGFHALSIDLRGHGRSGKPSPPYDWHLFAEDLLTVGREFALQGIVGIGHSLGGHAVTLAAARQPTLFARLLLIDPVILPREHYVGYTEFEHFTARRRSQWSSPDEMFERFKDRPPFYAWKPQVLRDYVDYGLLPSPGGDGYTLACAPEFEAATYNYVTAANIYPEIATIQIPVTILRAAEQAKAGEFNMSASPTAPDLAAYFPNALDVPLTGYSHFIPMEAPELVAHYVREIAQSL
ncbi:MAG: alpha/beta hydrolase [Chloroflexota bacterium]